MSEERYFIGNDGSGHDYIIPVSLRDKWRELTVNDVDEETEEEFSDIFSRFMVGRSLSSLTFTDYRFDD